MIRFKWKKGVHSDKWKAALLALNLPLSYGWDPEGGGFLEFRDKRDAAREHIKNFVEMVDHLFSDVDDPLKPIAIRSRKGHVLGLQPLALQYIADDFRTALDTGCTLDEAFGLTKPGSGDYPDSDEAAERFMIALARHKLGRTLGATADVADEYGCSPSHVNRAYKEFHSFLESLVDTAQ